MNFVLLDDKGGAIQGLVPISVYDKITDRFAEGRLCEIARFTVGSPGVGFQAVNHSFSLRFSATTFIRSLDPATLPIPLHILRSTQLEDIGRSITRTDQLVDIVARIAGFGDVQDLAGGGRVRHMYIVNERDVVLEVALWDAFIEKFDIPALAPESENSAVFVGCSSLQLRTFDRKYGLKTFFGTRFHFDPNIPEIANFCSRFPVGPMRIFTANADMPPNVHPLWSPSYARSNAKKVTLCELLMVPPASSSGKFSCVAEISSVNTSFDWFYLSCHVCHRKVLGDEDNPSCGNDQCSENSVKLVSWYRFWAQVIDGTADVEFVFIGSQAQLAVGVPASELHAEDNPTLYDAPPKLREIVGKRFLFVISIKHARSPGGSNQYTVSRIDPVRPEEAPLQIVRPASAGASASRIADQTPLQIAGPTPIDASAHDTADPPHPPVSAPLPATPAMPPTPAACVDSKLKRVASDVGDPHPDGSSSHCVGRRLHLGPASNDEELGCSKDAAQPSSADSSS